MTTVVFAVPNALHEWNASTVTADGMGASETMIVYLARALSQAGHEVQVYAPVPYEEVDRTDGASVSYFRCDRAAEQIPAGAKVVVSRAPLQGIGLAELSGKPLDLFLWLQDAKYTDFTPETAAAYKKIVCVSYFHRALMEAQHGIPLDKMDVIYNFFLRKYFPRFPRPKRIKHRFVYTSSPERGLVRLLEMWPRIRDRFPTAELHVFYGWINLEKLAAGSDPLWKKLYSETRESWLHLRDQPGIVDRGRVNHEALAVELMQADAFLYPSCYVETCCTAVLEAKAAGAVPVVTRFGALRETADSACTQFVLNEVNQEAFATAYLDAIDRAVHTTDVARAKMAKEAIESYKLETVVQDWLDLLSIG